MTKSKRQTPVPGPVNAGFDASSVPRNPSERGVRKIRAIHVLDDFIGLCVSYLLAYLLRFGFSPRKIFRLALIAHKDEYDRETILKWMKTFYRRFFSQQFKRSCLPDGPKVGTVAVSPRGDLRMPSDASAALWLAEIEGLS